MARQDIDIGVEGNDGTGDSIRESFRKTNENFTELYAVFGEEGAINFSSLSDTPDNLLPNTIPFVNSEGTFVNLVELVSNSALDSNVSDTIEFDYTVDGKLIITTASSAIDENQPIFKGPVNAGGNPIGNVEISEAAAISYNATHDGQDLTIDDLVITKGFGDRRYISSGLPIRVADEPENTDEFILNIEDYVDGNLLIPLHGIDRAANGSAFVYSSLFDDADTLTSGETYFIRYVSPDQIAVFNNSADAELIDDIIALSKKITVTGVIAPDDVHSLTDAGFDSSLEGNFLGNVAMPRESIVRRQGDTMTGELFLNDHPGELSGFGAVNGADDLQAATKFYVDTTSFSSAQNIFISTSGDDRMIGVPKGREGTSQDFAFRTINAASRRAEEVIRASEPEPGPYFQTVTTDNGDIDATVNVADIISPQAEQARKLININKEYIAREYIGYLKFEFPDFVFDDDDWQKDIELIADSIAYDINRGPQPTVLTANTLTRQSAEKFYATTKGRFKIQSETEQIVGGIEFVRDLVENILENKLYLEKDVELISVDGQRARVTTSQNHNLQNSNQVIFRNMGGLTEIENQTAYVRVISDTEFELYVDFGLQFLFDISSYSVDNYTTGGKIGKVYQPRVAEFESIKIKQEFDTPAAGGTERSAVTSKFNLVLDIIQNGIDAGQGAIFGNNYKIVLDNGSQSFVDQANPTDLNMIPGKIIVGKRSGARGTIVKIRTNDGTENSNDTFELVQLNARDFEIGEPVEFGNFVKKKQITLFIESGIYEEDFPIKLSNNVSVKGDEFRRVIIRPKQRVSQSTWADTYFYRDLEFDDIQILNQRHSTVTSVDPGALENLVVNDTSWMSVGQSIKFVGETLFVPELEKNTTYFIRSIESSTQITISETESGAAISFSASSGVIYIVDDSVAPFLNQTNQVQGYFGRHYLEDFTRSKNIGTIPVNSGNYNTAADILQLNKAFIIQELILYVNNSINTANSTNDTGSIWFGFSYDTDKWTSNLELVIDSTSRDLERGRSEFSLQAQGDIFQSVLSNEQLQFEDTLNEIIVYTDQLLQAQQPSQAGSIPADISLGTADALTVTVVENLKDLINFAFDSEYNPPKRNDADGVDVFQMGDATIVRNVTVQGQGGFMVVLDPESQILTKSPYIQTGSSFSKSDNEKRFRGGMFVDAFVGNIPARITNVVNAFELEVESDTGQGLFIRSPELPAPFYLDGIRYQINATQGYNSANGTATIVLDSGSNPDSSGIGQGYQGSAPQEIFIQTAGNRSMLGNDFTQINDLGYGLVTNNGAVSEMVSMFTYYCEAAYYANNGSEIRSLNGSNGYGNFGLVAEGADPNEIPDQVTLTNPMALSCKAYTTVEYTNTEDDPFITVYDLQTPPTNNSIITIDHGTTIGVLNYRISGVTSLTELEGETATGGTFSNTVYRLSIRADDANSNDFFGTLQDTVSNDTLIELRNVRTQIFSGVRSPKDLETRPSTAINFDESDLVTYRSLDFSTANSLAEDLPDNTILSVVEVDYDFIELEVDVDNISAGFGSAQGDTKIAVSNFANPDRILRLTRDIQGRQPGDSDYSGGMIFTFAGKTHQVVNFDNSGSFAFIDIQDVSGTNINSSYSGTGLNIGIPARERSLFAGLTEGSTAEITIAISLLRATGHDFTQIGAGGYNDSNYPNVIFGRPENTLADAYTDAATATSSQVWERRKGRVFFVSTDQEGFFRVGKFFTVDQATGSIEFAGDIGLTGANALGFTRGVTINEFSADDSFVDLSSQAVPTERAIAGYVNRVLGYNIQSNSQIEAPAAGNRLGPGFLPLNGISPMEQPLNLGQNQITNVAGPGSDGTAAANKNYVDERAQAYDELNDIRNIELNNVLENDVIVATGKKRIFTTPVTGGTISVDDTIGTAGGIKTGVVVDLESYSDDIEGSLNIITYTETDGVFLVGETIYDQPGETANATIVDGPVDEIANASGAANSVINVTVTRTASGAEYDFQIKDDTLTNADVNSSAAISQSKLSMQNADTFDEDDAITGWSGTADKLQSNLGLAKFSDENFETTEGFVRIKANGVGFAELNQIFENQVYGRTNEGLGDISAINFSDVVGLGLGLEDGDFDELVSATDDGFPGEALVKLDEGVYGITGISIGVAGNTIARRDTDGALDASRIKIDGDNILTRFQSTIRLDTPGGARVFSAAGNDSDSLVTKFTGNIDVGETARNNESTFQSGSSYAGEGWLASDWIYTSFIEAGSEGDGNSTGIGLGSGGGFANSSDNSIIFVTGGLNRLNVSNIGLTTDYNLTVEGTSNLNGNVAFGTTNADNITFTGSVNSNILPDTNSTRNIGSNAIRWDTVYADVFNGVATEAKYADLAEKYTADYHYEAGTVVVFGGREEITVTDKKGDRRVAGVVSTNPAYLMNSDLVDNALAIALQGRVPCKVLGKAAKGDMLVSSAIPGYAVVDNDARIGTVIGKSLEDKTDDGKSVIEIVVGRT